jgi:hypothetical protein
MIDPCNSNAMDVIFKAPTQNLVKPVGIIPVGFFTGSLSVYTGLFFRSTQEITFLSGTTSGIKSWRWPINEGSEGQVVTNYKPVGVTIEIRDIYGTK